MKKVILAGLMLASTAVFARNDTGVVVVRAASQSALHSKVQETVALLKSGRYRYAHDNCGAFAKRKPYAVETSGPRYRFDRYGNMSKYYSAAIKYSCR